MAKADAEQARNYTCSAIALAKLFRVTRGVIHDWHRSGMPQAAPGRFNLSDCLVWRRQRDAEVARASGGPLGAERRKLIVEQRRGHELDNASRAASLLPRDDVQRDVAAYQAILDHELDRLVGAVTADLAAASDPDQCRRVLADACRAARVQMAEALTAHADALAGEAKRENGARG